MLALISKAEEVSCRVICRHKIRCSDSCNFNKKSFTFPLRRVMELLTQDWSLSPKLRLPAISRLQKVHNTDVALQVLKNKGVDLKDEQGE